MMLGELQPTESCAAAILPEERARADMYGLIAALFLNAPSAELLQALAINTPAQPQLSAFTRAWQRLCERAAAAHAQQVADEFDALFVGVGPACVNPYAAHYLDRAQFKHSLAVLRGELAELRLGAHAHAGEPEDHISALCEAMRHLIIAGDAAGPAIDLETQRKLFSRHLQPWYGKFCASVSAAHGADFYRAVSSFAEAFFDLEAQSFDVSNDV